MAKRHQSFPYGRSAVFLENEGLESGQCGLLSFSSGYAGWQHPDPQAVFWHIQKICHGILSFCGLSGRRQPDLQERTGAIWNQERMVYIPNYVSKTAFYPRPAAERMQLRQQYGIAENAFVVLGVGQVQTRKGVMDFAETARLMPDVTFIWAGGFSFGRITDGYEKLKRVVESPPRNVRFLGIVPRDQMNDIFNLSDVLFVPSYNELFPMAVLEAVNLHLPLVLRDLDLYEDILFHQYMACADNAGFARALRILKEDPHEYQKYVSASSALSEYYSQEHVRAKWEEFYQRAYRHGKW